MPTNKPSKVHYTIGDDGVVQADLKPGFPYKISGTRLASAVGMSPWATPYKLACQLIGVYGQDIGDKPSVKAGQVLEKVIIDHLNANGYDIKTGEELFKPREGDHDDWPSDFEDPIFSGHIDGMTEDAIVEVKTSANPQDWQDGKIPMQYWLQASLYAVMLGKDKIIYPVGFLAPGEAYNPQNWDPSQDLYVFEAPVYPEIDRVMEEARTFYRTYALNGTTPEPMTKEDWELADMLRVESEEVCINGAIADLISLQDQERDIKRQIEGLRDRISLHMQYNHQTSIEAYGHEVVLSERSHNSVDTIKMKMDGVYDLYAKKTPYKQLTIKKLKE